VAATVDKRDQCDPRLVIFREAGMTARAENDATYGYPIPVSDVDSEQLAQQAVCEAAAEAAEGTAPVKVTYKVVEGNAAQVLLEESAGADLLVVGNRDSATGRTPEGGSR
jgi:nucleotide-binding universal stress UspA family protein